MNCLDAGHLGDAGQLMRRTACGVLHFPHHTLKQPLGRSSAGNWNGSDVGWVKVRSFETELIFIAVLYVDWHSVAWDPQVFRKG